MLSFFEKCGLRRDPYVSTAPTRRNRSTKNVNLKIKEINYDYYLMMGEGLKKHDLQDSIGINETYPNSFYFFAVYDGHGNNGKEASNTASDHMQTYLEKKKGVIKLFKTDDERYRFINKMFASTEKRLKTCGVDLRMSGTTCASVFLQDKTLYIANVGDSRVVLARINDKDRIAIELSREHKPNDPLEKKRILERGGKIEKIIIKKKPSGPFRVWANEEGPGIAMSRSLGDFLGKKIGIIHTPEIQHLDLTPDDKFIIIASDGIWDVMSSTEVVAFLIKCQNKDLAAQLLVKEARSRWRDLNLCKSIEINVSDFPGAKSGIDDISAIVVYFTFEYESKIVDGRMVQSLQEFTKQASIATKIEEVCDLDEELIGEDYNTASRRREYIEKVTGDRSIVGKPHLSFENDDVRAPDIKRQKLSSEDSNEEYGSALIPKKNSLSKLNSKKDPNVFEINEVDEY